MGLTNIEREARATRLVDGLKKCGKESWVEGDPGCGKIKPVADFGVLNSANDGLNSYCKECRAEYQKTDAGKAVDTKYRKTDAYKASQAKYHKSDAGKAYMAKHRQTAAYKACQAKSRVKPASFKTYGPKLSPYMEVRVSPEDSKAIQVKCFYCNQWTTPTVNEVRTKLKTINGTVAGEANIYCNQECKVSCPTYGQSKYPKGFKKATSRETQPLVRKMAFARDNHTCTNASCPQDGSVLHAHHINGIAHDPMVQSDLSNILTRCKTCHVAIHKTPGCTFNDYRCN